VVVATGYDRVPKLPDWPGRDTYTSELIHAVDYGSPKPYVGRDVLVVGVGNTGTEIATQLVKAGACRVRLAMRRPVNIMPSHFLGIPITLLARMSELQPVMLVDRMGFMVQRLAWGDLTKYGLAHPARGMGSEMRGPHPVVVIDKGFVAGLKNGQD
jgi:cation diffusion facilitator CzcD-associated flavoprotein CzcO